MIGRVVGILDDALPNDAEVLHCAYKLQGSHSPLGADAPLDDGGVVRAGSAPDVFRFHAHIVPDFALQRGIYLRSEGINFRT